MHLALAPDEGYFRGMACAIFSIVLAADRSQVLEFHVMDGGIADASWEMLTRKITALDSGIRFHRHSIALATFAGLPEAACGGPMTYARLLMESIIAADEVIYVDSDFLCFRNLRALWDTPMGSNLIAACQDRGVKLLKDDPVFELSEEDGRQLYFNAGLLKANLKAWRQERVQQRTLALLQDHGAQCLWWDQTALNAICKGRVLWLDPTFNQYYVQEVTLPELAEGRVNIHFAAKTKPWQTSDRKVFTDVLWRVHYRKFTGAGNRAAGLLKPFGTPLIALLCMARGCLAVFGGNDAAPVRWIRRRISRIQMIRWVLKRGTPTASH